MAFTVISAARHSLHPTQPDRTSNDAAGFASCYGPLSRFPRLGFRHWASTPDVSLQRRQSATGPPDSYPDRTHTGKRRRAYDHRRPTWSPPVCWSREKSGLGAGVYLFDTTADSRLEIAVLGASFPQLFSGLAAAATAENTSQSGYRSPHKPERSLTRLKDYVSWRLG